MNHQTINLRPISLNRLRILPYENLHIDPESLEKTSGELISLPALVRQIRRNGPALRLEIDSIAENSFEERDLPLLFDKCFKSRDTIVKATAQRIARRFGRDLGYIVLSLVAPDNYNRTTQKDAYADQWEKWHSINEFWLGGGLISGELGNHAMAYAQEILREAGCDTMLNLSPYRSVMPLVGAARHAFPNTEAMLIFDFGHSFAKRAIAIYHDGVLVRLQLVKPIPVKFSDEVIYGDIETYARMVLALMIDLIASTYKDNHQKYNLSEHVVCSLATHLKDNHPISHDGYYGKLRLLGDNLNRLLTEHIVANSQYNLHFLTLNDGVAAASSHATKNQAAAIMIGTAIGWGFVPSDNSLCPIADPLTITNA